MDRIPIEGLESLYESLPSNQIEFKRQLHSYIRECIRCQNQYDTEQRSPAWLTAVWQIVRYIGVIILANGYIIRTARTSGNETVLSQSFKYAFRYHHKILKALDDEGVIPDVREWSKKYKSGMSPKTISIFNKGDLEDGNERDTDNTD